MIEFVRTRHMDAPRTRIWPYVDDVTRWPEWFTEAERCEVLEGEGIGRRQRMYGHARGKATEIDFDRHRRDAAVAVALAPRGGACRREAGSVVFAKDATADVAIVPDGSGSLVTYRLMAEPGSVVNTFMLRVLAPRPIGRSFETSLARLAALAEAPG